MSALQSQTTQAQYLTFHLLDEEYAIGILQVREIIEFTPITKIPSTPIWIQGVINLRGAVVPVIDLKVKLGFAETTVTKRTCIIIVETRLDNELTLMGIIADSVDQVIDLSDADIEPPPSFGASIKVKYLLGMGKVGHKFVLILDLNNLLSTNELMAVANLQPEAIKEAEETSIEQPSTSENFENLEQ